MRVTAVSLFLLLASSAAAQDPGPEQLVRRVTDEVLATILSDKALQAGDKKKAVALFEEKVMPLLDFAEGARLAIGPAWRSATPEQQDRLVREFRTMIMRVYSNLISAYRGQTMRVIPLKMPPGATDVTVRNQYLRPGRPPLPVDYAMRKTASGWKMYDIKVDGISLVMTYRAEFEPVVREGGIEGLIKRISERNHPPAG